MDMHSRFGRDSHREGGLQDLKYMAVNKKVSHSWQGNIEVRMQCTVLQARPYIVPPPMSYPQLASLVANEDTSIMITEQSNC